MKVDREIIIVILFWMLYMPASLIIWSLIGNKLIEFIAIASIGVAITANYLFVESIIYIFKKRKKVQPDLYVGFRRLFSEEPLEVTK